MPGPVGAADRVDAGLARQPRRATSRSSAASRRPGAGAARVPAPRIPGVDLRERTTTPEGIELVPLERIDKRGYRRLGEGVSPPWRKRAYDAPKIPGRECRETARIAHERRIRRLRRRSGRIESIDTTQAHERWSHAMARTVREQQDKRREEKLKQVQEQVDDGSLVIRKMTTKERKANPPREPKPKKKR